MTSPIDVSNRRYLFFDDRFVERAEGVRWSVHRPRIAEPVIAPGPEGSPDDGMVGTYGQVLHDGDLFKMWINARSAQVLAGTADSWRIPTQLITSTDGIHWQRPHVGLIPWHGSTDNNLVCADWGYVMIDPLAPPAARYKLLNNHQEVADAATGGLYFATSPDGLHWTPNPTRVLPFLPDCFNQIFFDTRLRKYVAYMRCWPDGQLRGKAYGRAMCRVELDDPMQPWPYQTLDRHVNLWGGQYVPTLSHEFPVVMSYPGYTEEGCWTDLYDPHVVQYPWAEDAYFAFPELNHLLPDSPIENHSLVEIGMCVSHDGIRWQWPATDAYIPLEEKGHGRGGMLYNLQGMLRVGDEIFQYHAATDIDHHGLVGKVYGYQGLLNSNRIYRTVQRLDGFVSLDFPAAGGEVVSPPLTFTGDQLVLNLDAVQGGGRVELRDVAGHPLPGFTFADCAELHTDAVNEPVRWRGGSLAPLQGQPIRLAWRFTNAALYAMQFRDKE